MATRTIMTILALAVSVFAVPTTVQLPTPFDTFESTETSLDKRTVGAVTLSTGKNFTGSKCYVDLPLEKCINLNGYAGKTLSFQPDPDTECFLMQGKCNETMPYADLYNNSTDVGDLSGYSWIAKSQSYICFTAMYY